MRRGGSLARDGKDAIGSQSRRRPSAWHGAAFRRARRSASVSSTQSTFADAISFLAGGGEMGERMRATDWAATPLGHAAGWSHAIKTAVSLCLRSRFPILLWLGPELRLVYNDAYIPFLGDTKHPAMLGAPGRNAW